VGQFLSVLWGCQAHWRFCTFAISGHQEQWTGTSYCLQRKCGFKTMIGLKQCTFCQIVILMHLVLVRISTSLGLLSETHPLKGYKYLRYIQTQIPVKHGEHRSRLMVTWMICSYDLSTMSAQEKLGTIHLPKSAAFTMDCGRYRGEHTSS
jgi:hypothetical protein